jgi:hypothetical protein
VLYLVYIVALVEQADELDGAQKEVGGDAPAKAAGICRRITG